jgi:TolA-binding protein
MSSPFTPPEADQVIAPPSAIELLWMNHRGALLGGIALVILLGAVIVGVTASRHATELASGALLESATDQAGWNEVISKYPRTPAAADAMLLLAASLRDGGKLEESDALYSRFSESFQSSTLAVSGPIGRASNARVAGKQEDALSDYQQAAAAYPQSYGAPFALFSQARPLAQQGKMPEATQIIRTLGSTYPGSVSAQAAGAVQQQAPRQQ